MICSFGNKIAEDLFHGKNTKNSRKLSKTLHAKAIRLLDQINASAELNDLKIPPGNKLEALKHDRKGQYSIRINDQWRICFTWKNDGAHGVEVVDYH